MWLHRGRSKRRKRCIGFFVLIWQYPKRSVERLAFSMLFFENRQRADCTSGQAPKVPLVRFMLQRTPQDKGVPLVLAQHFAPEQWNRRPSSPTATLAGSLLSYMIWMHSQAPGFIYLSVSNSGVQDPDPGPFYILNHFKVGGIQAVKGS